MVRARCTAQGVKFLTDERVESVNGDGSERPVGDVNTVCTSGVNIFSIGAWGPDDLRKKEVVLWSGEPSAFKVLPDGTVKPVAEIVCADVTPPNLSPGVRIIRWGIKGEDDPDTPVVVKDDSNGR